MSLDAADTECPRHKTQLGERSGENLTGECARVDWNWYSMIKSI